MFCGPWCECIMLDVEENIKFAFSMSVFLVIILLPLSVKRSVICCMTHFSCRSVIQACNLSSKILINGGQRHQDLLYETGQQKSCVLQIKTMCLPWVSRRTLRGWNRLWGSLWDIPSWPVMSQALHQLEAFSFDETEFTYVLVVLLVTTLAGKLKHRSPLHIK